MEAEAAALQAQNWNIISYMKLCSTPLCPLNDYRTITVLVLVRTCATLATCVGLPHLDGVGRWNVEHATLKSSPYNCDRKLQQNSFCCLRISTGKTASARWNAEALEDVGFGKQDVNFLDKSSES